MLNSTHNTCFAWESLLEDDYYYNAPYRHSSNHEISSNKVNSYSSILIMAYGCLTFHTDIVVDSVLWDQFPISQLLLHQLSLLLTAWCTLHIYSFLKAFITVDSSLSTNVGIVQINSPVDIADSLSQHHLTMNDSFIKFFELRKCKEVGKCRTSREKIIAQR